jgi:hypothetical protein
MVALAHRLRAPGTAQRHAPTAWAPAAVARLGAGRLAPAARTRFTRVGSVLVALIGLQLVLRGAAAWGWIAHLSWGRVVFW